MKQLAGMVGASGCGSLPIPIKKALSLLFWLNYLSFKVIIK